MSDLVWWVGLALVVVGLYLWRSANRLDRLNSRVEGARSALDAQLVRRSSVTLELATAGLLDPATSVLLADAAHEARDATAEERALAESSLSRALRVVIDEPGQVADLDGAPGGPELLRDLAGACRRVVMARRFHNDAVTATRAVRGKWVVRWFRLAGRSAPPTSFEMDDEPPKLLGSSL